VWQLDPLDQDGLAHQTLTHGFQGWDPREDKKRIFRYQTQCQFSPGLYDLYCITNTITLYSNVQGLLINLSFLTPSSIVSQHIPPSLFIPHFAPLTTPPSSLRPLDAFLRPHRKDAIAPLLGDRLKRIIFPNPSLTIPTPTRQISPTPS
jgi:hypothetical protein